MSISFDLGTKKKISFFSMKKMINWPSGSGSHWHSSHSKRREFFFKQLLWKPTLLVTLSWCSWLIKSTLEGLRTSCAVTWWKRKEKNSNQSLIFHEIISVNDTVCISFNNSCRVREFLLSQCQWIFSKKKLLKWKSRESKLISLLFITTFLSLIDNRFREVILFSTLGR